MLENELDKEPEPTAESASPAGSDFICRLKEEKLDIALVSALKALKLGLGEAVISEGIEDWDWSEGIGEIGCCCCCCWATGTPRV
jgi:hypothetical protein